MLLPKDVCAQSVHTLFPPRKASNAVCLQVTNHGRQPVNVMAAGHVIEMEKLDVLHSGHVVVMYTQKPLVPTPRECMLEAFGAKHSKAVAALAV